MTEPITLDLVDGTGGVGLDLRDTPVNLDLAEEPVALDLTGDPETVALDLNTETEQVTVLATTEVVAIDFTDATVTLGLTASPAVSLDAGPERGPMGPPGPSGVGASFVWNQAAANVVWTIPHTVPYRPNVTVVDSAGTVLIADVSYPTDTTVIVAHQYATAGYAYLS